MKRPILVRIMFCGNTRPAGVPHDPRGGILLAGQVPRLGRPQSGLFGRFMRWSRFCGILWVYALSNDVRPCDGQVSGLNGGG